MLVDIAAVENRTLKRDVRFHTTFNTYFSLHHSEISLLKTKILF